MTPARRYALQWFHDRGEVTWFRFDENPPSKQMRRKMVSDGQLQESSQGNLRPIIYSLTDKGRRALHGDSELNRMTGNHK
jgi:hypothetical protein